MKWMQIVHQYLDGAITQEEMTAMLVLELGNAENDKCHFCNEIMSTGTRCSHCGAL